MGNPEEMRVEVAYATPDRQTILAVQIEDGATIEMVIARSGILTLYPEIDLDKQKVGIFSQIKSLSDTVKAGDRIEIYRALTFDPKESRRQRAEAAGQILRKKHSRRRSHKRS